MNEEMTTALHLEQYPKTKATFNEFKVGYLKQMSNAILFNAQFAIQLIDRFEQLPFDYQQGVYLAFLREKGIDAEARVYYPVPDIKHYNPFIYINGFLREVEEPASTDYRTTLITAIEAGFKHLEA